MKTIEWHATFCGHAATGTIEMPDRATADDIADEVFDAIQNRIEYDWYEVEPLAKKEQPS